MKSLIVGDKATVERLAERLKQATSHSQYQRIQCVLIRATLGSSAAQIAQLLGWSKATVHVLHSRWAKEDDAIFELRGRGGRRHQHLSEQQEKDLLAPFVERAQGGGMLTLTEIQQAYQEQVGKKVAPSTVYRLLDRHGWRKVVPRPKHPKADVAAQGALKKLRRQVRQEVVRQAEHGRTVRLMFQDEGRFGLLGTPRRCWAPHRIRPIVGARLERKYLYAFSAVSPHDGVMDQAGWHLAGDLVVPANMRLIFLPPYSPEFNPAEHLWKAIREDVFANHVFADLNSVEAALSAGLLALESDSRKTQSMTGFEWETSISLNAK